MNYEKAIELGQDIEQTQRYLSIIADTQETVETYRDTTGTDTLAAIAWDAFCDACDAYDAPCALGIFQDAFPVLGELV